MLESKVDQKIVEYAKKRGLVAIKLTMLAIYGFAGLPDRLFIGPNRVIFFIEMKSPGKTRTALQKWWGDKLESFGFNVYECGDIEYGKQIIDYELQPA